MVKGLLYGILFSGLSLFNLGNNFSQDFEDCDYLRKIKVNQREVPEGKNEILSSKFVLYNDFKDAVGDEAKNSFHDGVMNIYFPNASYELTENDLIDLNRYISKVLVPYVGENNVKKMNVNIEGYANYIGNEEYNYNLSLNRAEAVANVLKKKFYCYFPFGVDLRVSAFGESNSGEDSDVQLDRRVKIFVEENPLERILNNLSGNVFLIDQSGSMNDGSWDFLKDYKFPKAKKYFSFSKPFFYDKSLENNFNWTYDINSDVAFGKTNFYEALDKLIHSGFVSNGDTLTVVINGNDNVGGPNVDDLISKSKNKNLTVNILEIGIEEDFKKNLIRFSLETSGKYYALSKSSSSKSF